MPTAAEPERRPRPWMRGAAGTFRSDARRRPPPACHRGPGGAVCPSTCRGRWRGTATGASTRRPRLDGDVDGRACWTPDGPADGASSTGPDRCASRPGGPGRDHARRSAHGDDRHRPPARRRRRPPPAGHRRRPALRRACAPAPAATSTTPCCRRSWPSGSPPARPCASGPGCATSSASRRPGPDLGLAAAAAPRAPRRPPGVVVPPARHRGQAGPRPHRGRPHRRPPVGLGARSPSTSWRRCCRWSGASDRGPSARCSARCAATTTPSRSATTTCPNLVAWNLAGEPRADDARMLALLEPFRGQRGRVLRLLGLGRAPRHRRSVPADESSRCTDGEDRPTDSCPRPATTRRRPTNRVRPTRPPPTTNGDRRGAVAHRPTGARTLVEPAPWPSASAPSSCPACACSPAPACGPARSPSTPTSTSSRARARRSASSPACSPSGTACGTWRSSAAATRARSRRTSPTSSSRRAPRSSRCTRRSSGSPTASCPAATRSPRSAVNFVLAVVAVVLVGVLARRLFDTDVAERAMVLFAVFPGSFVLSYAYAEALLIVLAALCLWFLLDERWLLAGVDRGAGDGDATERPRARRGVRRRRLPRHPRPPRLVVARRPAARTDRLHRLPGVPRRPHRRVVAVVPRPDARRGGRARASGRRRSATR